MFEMFLQYFSKIKMLKIFWNISEKMNFQQKRDFSRYWEHSKISTKNRKNETFATFRCFSSFSQPKSIGTKLYLGSPWDNYG